MPGRTMSEKSSLRIEQSEKYEGEDWWLWSVWVDGPKRDLDAVDLVEYTLHHSFRDPVRTVRTRHNGFKLETEGWGVFPIYARVCKKDKSVIRLKHQLKLTYPDGKPNLK
jgi:transcription initiation factor IIF auxiliary subunit